MSVAAEELQSEEKEAKGWGQRWKSTREAFANVGGAIQLVWQAHPTATLAMAVVTVAFALLPAASAWAAKLIVDTIVNSLSAKTPVSEGLSAVLPWLLLEFGLITLTTVLSQLRTLLDHLINARLAHSVQNQIMAKALTLDLHYFENAKFYDKMQNAQREVNWRPVSIVNSSFLMVQDVITLVSLGVLLTAFGPIVALLLFGAAVPSFIAQMRYSKLYFRLLTWHSPDFRRKSYWESLLTLDSSMKEIKLFGLGNPLLGRYNRLFNEFYREDAALAKRKTIIATLWGIFATAGYYGAYGWVVYRTLEGAITLGDLTLYLAVLRQGQGSFTGLFHSLGEIYEGSLFMSNLFGFLKLKPQTEAKHQASRPVPEKFQTGFEFRNVSFRYPDREDWAIRNLNLHIAPGEKLALVGANGAGKTTLVKLLTRLYETTEGQILLDGVDLREYDTAELRERIGVIFQDFVRYQATARENIGFGQISALEDEGRIVEAAKRGGADAVMDDLPQKYDTLLGKWFDNGHDLSGGEWQKMALSRAFMRNGNLLVLDEPTSALDAEREYEIFQRFRELTEGKMALLISHRFSTVRMADRIAVLENGQIIELGTHQELLKLGGTYAHLFNLQAEGYR